MTDHGITPLSAMVADTVNPPRLRKRGERFNDRTIRALISQGRREDACLYCGDDAVADFLLRYPEQAA